MGGRAVSGEVELRRPIEADHRFLVNSVDDWWGGRKMHQLLPRLWFQHFSGTSWIAVVDDRIVGFLIGFISPDRPDEAYIHMVGTSPNHRGAGLGRVEHAGGVGDDLGLRHADGAVAQRRAGAGQMGIQLIGRAQQGVGPGTGLR